MRKVKVHTFSGPGELVKRRRETESVCVKGKESEESLNQSES